MMTSKEICENLMEYIIEENQGYFDKKRIGNDLTAILIDLGKLEHIKALVKIYNNDEMHFERGFDFINVVKEVLEND